MPQSGEGGNSAFGHECSCTQAPGQAGPSDSGRYRPWPSFGQAWSLLAAGSWGRAGSAREAATSRRAARIAGHPRGRPRWSRCSHGSSSKHGHQVCGLVCWDPPHLLLSTWSAALADASVAKKQGTLRGPSPTMAGRAAGTCSEIAPWPCAAAARFRQHLRCCKACRQLDPARQTADLQMRLPHLRKRRWPHLQDQGQNHSSVVELEKASVEFGPLLPASGEREELGWTRGSSDSRQSERRHRPAPQS